MSVKQQDLLHEPQKPPLRKPPGGFDWLWAPIVWLNYAAWLHMRLTRGWRGAPLA